MQAHTHAHTFCFVLDNEVQRFGAAKIVADIVCLRNGCYVIAQDARPLVAEAHLVEVDVLRRHGLVATFDAVVFVLGVRPLAMVFRLFDQGVAEELVEDGEVVDVPAVRLDAL